MVPESGTARTEKPTLSVVVPVYNSTSQLSQCLAALANSNMQGYEVIVVDDGSTEPVEPLVVERGFRYVRIEGPGGPARARNRGVAVARGEHVAFVDADVLVQSDTLSRISEAFDVDAGVVAVVGCYDDDPPGPGFVSQFKNLFHHYVHDRNAGEVVTFWSGCGAMKKDVFMKFGGFDEHRYRRPAIEDVELGTWVSSAGHRIVLDNRIRVKHLKQWTLWSMVKTDIIDRGIPWTRLMLRSGGVPDTLNVTGAQRLSVVLVYLTVGCVLLAAWRPVALIAAVVLAVIVTVLNLDFYRFISTRRGLGFVLRAVPLHWLYFLYCGASFVMGAATHFGSRDLDGSRRS